jgi:cytoskeletal protein CcmA (bactofilin family)
VAPFTAEKPLSGFLGPGVLWTGDLAFEGRFRVDGTFRGRIFSEHLLEVGETGVVEGQIDVAEAVVSGRLSGTIHVKGQLLVESTGRIEGDLTVGQLVQRRGAEVKAKVTRNWEKVRRG